MIGHRRRSTEIAAAAAAAVFLCAWAVLHTGKFDDRQIVDIPVYMSHGERTADGEIPYRDFRVEYPPGSLPVFVGPALVSSSEQGFRWAFETIMAACGMALAALAGLALAALGASRRRVLATLAFVSLFPLALGSVVLTRFDLWPALLVAAGYLAILSGRERLGLGVLGAAVAVKLYPLVLIPVALSYVWVRRGRRESVVAAGIAGGVAAACVLPFFVLSPGGFLDSIGHQLSRPLQLESLGAALFLAAHQLFGVDLVMSSGHGSQNLAGTGPAVAAVVTSAIQLAALVWIWTRRVATSEELVRWSAAALVAFVALGKVLSPQFLIWLVPLVPLVRGRRGLAASALLAVALVLTQLWFPYRYWDLALRFDATASWLVLGRDLLLVAALVVLVRPTARRREPARSP